MTKSLAKKGSKSKPKFKERITKFFKGVWSELKKVHWPNQKELVSYVSVVLVSVFVVSAVIWIIDSVFSFLLDLVL